MKDLIVYNIKVAQELVRAGFDIKNVKPNNQDQTKVVFYFVRSEESEEILKQLTQNK